MSAPKTPFGTTAFRLIMRAVGFGVHAAPYEYDGASEQQNQRDQFEQSFHRFDLRAALPDFKSETSKVSAQKVLKDFASCKAAIQTQYRRFTDKGFALSKEATC